jgi:hypothetical protein
MHGGDDVTWKPRIKLFFFSTNQIPPIQAIVGGFDKANIVKSGITANKAYKSDIQQVGCLIEDILNRCGYSGQFEEVNTFF